MLQTAEAVGNCTLAARKVLQWADQNGPWRSVTLAGGAFPASIQDLAVGTATPVRRHDADFYEIVVGLQPPIIPDFGDYGIRSPCAPLGGGRGTPNLKYAYQRHWWVYKENPIRGSGNIVFYTICQNLVASTHWLGAPYSPGDADLDGLAHATPTVPGGGNTTQWLQWGTSHHLAHTVDRLSTLGVP